MTEFIQANSNDEDLPVLTDLAKNTEPLSIPPDLKISFSSVEDLSSLMQQDMPFGKEFHSEAPKVAELAPQIVEEFSFPNFFAPEDATAKESQLEPLTPVVEPTPDAIKTISQADDKKLFPFELLLVDDHEDKKPLVSEPDNETAKDDQVAPVPSPSVQKSDALSRIEDRLAELSAKSRETASQLVNTGALKPKMAVLGESALTDQLYNAILPQMKREVMAWMQEILALQAKQMCDGVLRQFDTDYEVIFGDSLRKKIRITVSEARRQSISQSK